MADLIDRDALLHEVSTECSNAHEAKYYDAQVALTRAKRIICDAPAVNRWIPVDDALPEIGYNVLVTRQTESNARYTRIASRQDDCWMDSTDEYGKPNPHPVIAWMPMPDAYKPPERE